MASQLTTIGTNILADRYVAGSNEVGVYHKIHQDYTSYVHDIAPLLDNIIESSKKVMAEHKAINLPTW